LIQGLRDESSWVRRNAAEALGTIAAPAEDIVPALIQVSTDSEMLVRLNAVMALAKIGQSADGIVPALAGRLSDEDRYVRYYAAAVLRQIGTPEAQNALWDDLLTSRWCPITTAENPY
jgi:HEAT repeat protein